MARLTIRGSVLLEAGEFPVAGVLVVASMVGEEEKSERGNYQAVRVQLGRVETDSDGAFVIETDPDDARVARWACVLQSCGAFQFRLAGLDRDETVLFETEPRSYNADAPVEIELADQAFEMNAEEWKELGRRMMAAQAVRIDDLAIELATLAPRGLFRDWTVARRLGILGSIEQALLDPGNVLGNSGLHIRFRHLSTEPGIVALRERIQAMERPELLDVLERSVDRARRLGDFREVAAHVDVDLISRGDLLGGVNHYLDTGVGIGSDLFPWLASPLVGYRDYLRDRWIDNQRTEPQFGGPDVEVATRATMIARLNARFHQDFATGDTTDQPANRVAVRTLLKILPAPPGTGYGFGIAAIDPQGERDYREYLDYLISLSGISVEELEKRYRLNLRRSELERSNPVQQNIETLQRFFTDGYQSIADPFTIAPDRKPGTAELLIGKFPLEGAGPFFLEYEEWLDRETPFYPENHYDPRATYRWEVFERFQKTREIVWANSMPLGDFVGLPSSKAAKFLPGNAGYDHRAAKWQWVRNHIELWDLVSAAHSDAKSLNFVGAEEKYNVALAWTTKLRDFVANQNAAWQYDPADFAKKQKNADVSTVDKLAAFERLYSRYFGHHYDSSSGSLASDLLAGNAEISDRWWGKTESPFFWPGNKREIRYLLDYLQFRHLPACLSEVQLALGKYADAVRQLVGRYALYQQTYRWYAGPAGFNVFAAKASAGGSLGIGPRFAYYTDGPLAYASSSDRTEYPPPAPPTSVPTNRAELGWFKLKLGNATLEWADVLYRTNEPDSIMRARELYKAVIFLHDEDPEISPTWDRRGGRFLPPFPWKKSARNPAIVSQVNRGRLGFLQINAGLNYYGVTSSHVPPVRYRVLKEAADRFAAGARGAQSDFLSYMQQLDQLTVSEMQARTMVAKANAAISIAQEQQKIAEFNVGEAQKQVDAINGQIAAKKAEIAKKDEFFEQVKDFAGGMADSVGKLGEMAFAGEGDAQPASAQQLSTGDILKLGFKVGTASNVLGSGASALAGAAGVAGPFGAFLYAGVTSMSGLADAIAKRASELAHLQNVALPAAKALVDVKKRDVTIAQLTQTIARADWQLGKDLLTFYAQRFLNRSFLVSMSEFSNRLMRRYLDLAGRTGWIAERALAFEQDRELRIIAFDYFPRNLRGVSGADLLQLHLAELEAARIQGLTQTIPVKHTISLARDFPVQFGQLKKTGRCNFATSEQPLRLVHPGVYGYRVRNITVAATYTNPIEPHRGLFSNQGVSVVTREKLGSSHTLVRYPDALPLSEFRMRNDMWVFDLPDETLLPFEGSGIETLWELQLSRIGNPNGFDAMADMFVTFDMRASFSAVLQQQHLGTLPPTANRSVLVSAAAMNPGALAKFRADGGVVTLAFDLAKAVRNANETGRQTLNFVLIAVGDTTAFDATFSSTNPVASEVVTFDKGVALSNAGALAGGNAGVPLPLNTFTAIGADQVFTLEIDPDANAGVDLTKLTDVLLLAEYDATYPV